MNLIKLTLKLSLIAFAFSMIACSNADDDNIDSPAAYYSEGSDTATIKATYINRTSSSSEGTTTAFYLFNGDSFLITLSGTRGGEIINTQWLKGTYSLTENENNGTLSLTATHCYSEETGTWKDLSKEEYYDIESNEVKTKTVELKAEECTITNGVFKFRNIVFTKE
ncbi:MAG: hypothetical protein K5873_04005 [Treponema sp.]|nr:hypothetical protein [Treponema sp.]